MALHKRRGSAVWQFAMVVAVAVALSVKAQEYAGPYIDPAIYSRALEANYWFYEAQGSGNIKDTEWFYGLDYSRVEWRGASFLGDGKGDNGVGSRGFNTPNAWSYTDGQTFAGGWFDNGGFVKNTLSMGASASLLAYGALSFENAYRAANVWDDAVKNFKWVADYLKNIHVDYDGLGTKLVAQIGDVHTDDKMWKAPENVDPAGDGGGVEGSDTWRPLFTVTPNSKRGSDIAGQTIAALAATAIAMGRDTRFNRFTGEESDRNTYGYEYAVKAMKIYEWQKENKLKGVYIVPDGNLTMLSRTYRDDMAWAAGWLCRWQLERRVDGQIGDRDTVVGAEDGTYNPMNFCQEARSWWSSMYNVRGMQPWLSSDVMHVAVALLYRDLVELGATELYDQYDKFVGMVDDTWAWWEKHFDNPCKDCVDTGLCHTPDGFMVLNLHGSAHLTMNMALVALLSGPRPGEAVRNIGYTRPYFLSKVKRQCWVKNQTDYLLGGNTRGQAFVTGLTADDDYLPGGVSVPQHPRHRASNCDYQTNKCPLPDGAPKHTLRGALVGGPGWMDTFVDSINSFQSLVSIEYNAGFAGVLAGLSAFNNIIPDWSSYCPYTSTSAGDAVYGLASAVTLALTSPTEAEGDCLPGCPFEVSNPQPIAIGTSSKTGKSCSLMAGNFTILGSQKRLGCDTLWRDDLGAFTILDPVDGKMKFRTYSKDSGSYADNAILGAYDVGIWLQASIFPLNKTADTSAPVIPPFRSLRVWLNKNGELWVGGEGNYLNGTPAPYKEREIPSTPGGDATLKDSANGPFTFKYIFNSLGGASVKDSLEVRDKDDRKVWLSW